MELTGRRNEDFLEVARVLLLVQGAILVATTIEALLWSFVFPGAGGAFLLSAISAVVILASRIRLRADRRWSRRLVYIVEGSTLAAVAIDIVLAVVLVHSFPPLVALLTQLALPISVIVLLRRSARPSTAFVPSGALMRSEGVS
jgi:hypothetical protein